MLEQDFNLQPYAEKDAEPNAAGRDRLPPEEKKLLAKSPNFWSLRKKQKFDTFSVRANFCVRSRYVGNGLHLFVEGKILHRLMYILMYYNNFEKSVMHKGGPLTDFLGTAKRTSRVPPCA